MVEPFPEEAPAMPAPVLMLALLAADPVPELDFRSPDGTVLIAADQIVSYDWAMHTLTLKPGTREAVRAAVFRTGGDHTFVATVGGKEAYRGTWKSVVESASSSTAVIVLDNQRLHPKLPAEQIRIDLGYPARNFFKGDDPRGHPAVKGAVKAKPPGITVATNAGNRELTGKDAEAYRVTAAWLEERMKEAEAVKPGTTYAELTKAFKTDGGISKPTVHRFVSVLCPYLKIDVEFEGDAKHPLAKDARVKAVSKPYFEREFGD